MIDRKKLADLLVRRYNMGGPINGASHDKGGVILEAEGGEYIVRKDSVNPQTKAVLEYINEYGKLPTFDARKRGGK